MSESIRIKSEEPVVLYCGRDTDLTPGIVYGPVVQDFYVFEICIKGAGAVVINAKEFPIKAGDCYIMLPGDSIIHKTDAKHQWIGIRCTVGGVAVGRYLKKAGISSTSPFACPEAFNELYSCLERMLTTWEAPDAGSNLKLTGYIYDFLSILFRNKKAQASGDEWIDKALGIIESRYHEILTVNELAEATGLERAYFSTLFKQKLGLSPHEYITSFKLKKARSLLEDTSASIGSIAESVGIPSENFSRVFRKEFGITPNEYRKTHKQ